MIIAGTGHRPSKAGGYSKEAHADLVLLAYKYLYSLPEKPIIISGMALGWDQALARAAMTADLELWAYIPFVGQQSVWPKGSRDYYNFLLEYASKKVICSTGLYTATKMQVRNERMVDDSDVILAYWDGSAGGTGNCIRYAIEKDKPIINLFK